MSTLNDYTGENQKLDERLTTKACILAVEQIVHLMNDKAKDLFTRIKDVENSKSDILQRIKDAARVKRDVEEYVMSFGGSEGGIQSYCAWVLIDLLHKNLKELPISISYVYSEQGEFDIVEDYLYIYQSEMQHIRIPNAEIVSIAKTAEIYKSVLGVEIIKIVKLKMK